MSMGNYDRQTDQPTGPPIVEFHLQDECIYGAVLYKVMEVWLLLIMTNRPTDLPPPNQKTALNRQRLAFSSLPTGGYNRSEKKEDNISFASSPCQVNEADEDPKPRRQHNYLTPPHSGPQLSRVESLDTNWPEPEEQVPFTPLIAVAGHGNWKLRI